MGPRYPKKRMGMQVDMQVYDAMYHLMMYNRYDEVETYLKRNRPKAKSLRMPLMYACRHENTNYIELLIKYGADPVFALKQFSSYADAGSVINLLLRHINRWNGMIPFLVGMHKHNTRTLENFFKHPLYTRDVLRSIMRLAIDTTTRESSSSDSKQKEDKQEEDEENETMRRCVTM